jgi:hypothetical protein
VKRGEKGEGQKVMSCFPSYSQWLAERANSLEGIKRWMHGPAVGGEKREMHSGNCEAERGGEA